MPITRRDFCTAAALITLPPRLLRAQTSARVDVAGVEHYRVVSEAAAALTQPVRTITTVAHEGTDAHAFYSESDAVAKGAPFRAHVEALIDFSTAVSTLTAAFVLTREDRYATRAGEHLKAWFADPSTSMKPDLQSAYANATTVNALAAGVVDGVALAEVARSVQFLVDALPPEELAATKAWFTSFHEWLNTSRIPVIARDTRDHTASAWLLLAAACARLLGDDTALNACRHRFKSPTLRNQIQATGVFHHEVVSEFPYRNSLFNFDMLAGACELLSTPFATLWPYELEDGPGMRGVVAFLYPVIRELARWPYPADPVRFREVPRRRPGLLLAGRAYTRPEYVDLWRSLPSPPADDPLRASFPIRQPLLWVTRTPHNG